MWWLAQICKYTCCTLHYKTCYVLNRVCPEEGLWWGESFDKLLSHKDGLTRFLKTKFSEENIEFWMAYEDFKKSKDPQQMFFKAKAIYEKFTQNDAPPEVNLYFHTKELIIKSITQPTLHIFDAHRAECISLWRTITYVFWNLTFIQAW